MRLLILSDLHLEHGTSFKVPPRLEYDAVVLAGDVQCPGHKAVHWAARDSTFGGRPVLLVCGNHEFYGCEMATELKLMRQAARGTNVHVLQRDAVVLDDLTGGQVRFLGCMLWTDFSLPVRYGPQPGSVTTDTDIGGALAEANRRLNDFRLIKVEEPGVLRGRGEQVPRRLLRAEDTLAMHWVERDWLRRELEKPFAGLTIVVTHHAPSKGSVAECYAADWLTPAFVSDLPTTPFFDVPALWVHGHTHWAFDYQVGTCRVLSNPRGYRRSDSSFENAAFDPCLVATVPAANNRPEQLLGEAERPRDEWEPAQAARADMVGAAEGAVLAGVSEAKLVNWAALKHPRVIAVKHPQLGLRFPRWQFEPLLWPVVQQLAVALDASCGATVLGWLETPQGAFQGRTPRAALEQGEPAGRVLMVADHAL